MRVHDLAITKDFQLQDLQRISHKANQFISEIIIEFDYNETRNVIDVKSLLGMLLLPIKKGTTITIKTKGRDEKEAIDFLCELIENYKQ
ncbi:HPr family phosphocarrier protein [Paenibacillus tarimensis]